MEDLNLPNIHMPTVTIKSEEELLQLSADVLNIMNHMRHAQKYWQEHYGAEALARKKVWERRADQLLDRYGLTEHNRTDKIQILKDPL